MVCRPGELEASQGVWLARTDTLESPSVGVGGREGAPSAWVDRVHPAPREEDAFERLWLGERVQDGGEGYRATGWLDMSVVEAAEYAWWAWQMEMYPQGLKRFTGIERGQFRMEKTQRDHMGLAIRAFLRLEIFRLQKRVTWFEAKHTLLRQVIRAYLAQPTITLPATA